MPAIPRTARAWTLSVVAVVVAACAAVACGAGLAGPEDLRLTAEVLPNPVVAGDSFVVRVTVTNAGSDPFVLNGPCPRLGVPRVKRDGEELAFEGAPVGEYVCAIPHQVPQVTSDTVFPARPVVYAFPMRAAIRVEPGEPGEPAAPGTYVFVFDAEVGGLANLEEPFVVDAGT